MKIIFMKAVRQLCSDTVLFIHAIHFSISHFAKSNMSCCCQNKVRWSVAAINKYTTYHNWQKITLHNLEWFGHRRFVFLFRQPNSCIINNWKNSYRGHLEGGLKIRIMNDFSKVDFKCVFFLPVETYCNSRNLW